MEEGTTEWTEVEYVTAPKYITLGPEDTLNDDTDEFTYTDSGEVEWRKFKNWTGRKLKEAMAIAPMEARRKV